MMFKVFGVAWVSLVFVVFPAAGSPYSLVSSFGNLTNATGLNPQAPLLQGPDGTLYGTTSSGRVSGTQATTPGEGYLLSTLFSLRPDGTGFRVLKYFISTNTPAAGGTASLDGALVLSGTTLYGTSERGGRFGHGFVFAINTDGSGYTNLYEFTASNDGVGPFAGLALSGGKLYGTTYSGGKNGGGTVFALNTDGTGFTNLFNFSSSANYAPYGGVVVAGNQLYGTTSSGGHVFALNTDGTGFTNLANIGNGSYATLVLANGRLYGAATAGNGIVFAVNTNGTAYQVLHTFTSAYTGGASVGGLVLVGTTLYGTTYLGGDSGNGTVFSINTNGMAFTNLYSFTGGKDGANPVTSLLPSGTTLFGAALNGGAGGAGNIFAIGASGTGFTNLFSFHYSDAAYPEAPLVRSGSTFYGTTYQGGAGGSGAIFACNANTGICSNLYSFSPLPASGQAINSDGAYPEAGLAVAGNTLYGTTSEGGTNSFGTIFSIKTDGTGFTNLFNFSLNSGSLPYAGVVLAGNALYGAATLGGANGNGTLFAINTDGTGFSLLHTFTATTFDPVSSAPTNSDGSSPYGTLLLIGNTLYGTTYQGGSAGNGSIFALTTNGGAFTNLHNFSLTVLDPSPFGYTNADGAHPFAGLALLGDSLYGTASAGGNSAVGTVFSLKTNGTAFSTLCNFSNSPTSFGTPRGGLVTAAGRLYGTATTGGFYGYGGVFGMDTNGSFYASVHDFVATAAGGSDGGVPYATLLSSSNTLYGTTMSDGAFGDGTLFSVDLGLKFQLLPNKLVLSWGDPTFSLLSATNVAGPYTVVSPATSPYTNLLAGAQKFFKLQPK
jgi:uncharacterized repeat protein (TIGR03803 family)